MAKKKRAQAVLSPKGVKRLLEGGGEELSDDERALLLALAEVDAENLNEKERAALDKLKGQMEGYDPQELAQAVEHMVKATPREGQKKLEWPELKRRK